jgi:capsular polysaccharide transport system ATP-binding protein
MLLLRLQKRMFRISAIFRVRAQGASSMTFQWLRSPQAPVEETADAMIEFHNISKAYRTSKGKKVIIDNFSGVFPRGRNIGLLGVNGSGKSTLIRMIAGIEYPDRGRIKRRVRVSYPLGLTGLKANLSGRENCRFVARVYGLDVRSVERFVEEFAEIGKYFDMAVCTYSSGMRSRVNFGISMAVDFECYLLDEALSVGDGIFRARADAIFEAKRNRASMILVSHSPQTIRQYCDMGAVLSKGRLRLYDNLDDAVDEYDAITRHHGKLE